MIRKLIKKWFLSKFIPVLEPVYKTTDLNSWMFTLLSKTGEPVKVKGDSAQDQAFICLKNDEEILVPIHSGELCYLAFHPKTKGTNISTFKLFVIFKLLGNHLLDGLVTYRVPESFDDKAELYSLTGFKFTKVGTRLDEQIYSSEDGYMNIVNDKGEPLSFPPIPLFKQIILPKWSSYHK